MKIRKLLAALVLASLLLAGCNCDWQQSNCPVQVVEKSLISR